MRGVENYVIEDTRNADKRCIAIRTLCFQVFISSHGSTSITKLISDCNELYSYWLVKKYKLVVEM